MSALIEQHITKYLDFGLNDDSQYRDSISSIAQLVSQKVLTIKELITALGSFLTGTDEKLRGRATLLLVEVTDILSFDPINISSNSITQLSIFFSGRLSDFPSLLSSLRGLEVIISHHSDRVIPRNPFIRGIAKAIGEVNVQSLSQSYRAAAYRVYLSLLSSDCAVQSLGGKSSSRHDTTSAVTSSSRVEAEQQRNTDDDIANLSYAYGGSDAAAADTDLALVNVSRDLVDAIISATDGERDPRTLLLSLGLMRRMLDSFDRDIIDLFADRVS